RSRETASARGSPVSAMRATSRSSTGSGNRTLIGRRPRRARGFLGRTMDDLPPPEGCTTGNAAKPPVPSGCSPDPTTRGGGTAGRAHSPSSLRGHQLPAPALDGPCHLVEGTALGGKRVGHADRGTGLDRATQQATCLELFETGGEDLRANPAAKARELAESERSCLQHPEDQGVPGTAQHRDGGLEGTALGVEMSGHARFLRTQCCDYPNGSKWLVDSALVISPTSHSSRRQAMDVGLLVLRLVLGLTLAAHGSQKLFGWFGGYGIAGTGGYFEQLGFRPGKVQAVLAGLSEFGGGLGVAAGPATPPGAARLLAP